MAGPEEERPRERLRRRGRQPLPDSADATDIAMSVLARDKAPDYPARVLLAQQAALASEQRRLLPLDLRHRRLQLVSERIGIAFRLALILLVLLLLLALALMIADAARSKKVIVEPFAVPAALAETGATGEVVATGLVDELLRLQAATRTDDGQPSVADAWSGDIKLQLPQTGASVGEIRRLLAATFGNDTNVRGDVVRVDGDLLRLTVRGEGIPSRSFSGRLRDLPALTARAAEHVYGSAEPALFLLYLNQVGRAADAVKIGPQAFQAARSPESRSAVAQGRALALSRQQRYEEAREQARLALSLNPWNWRAHTSLVGAYSNEEAALAASRWLRARAAASSLERRPREPAFVNEFLLRQDWTALVAMYRQDARDTIEQGTDAFAIGPLLAEAEAHRHDHRGASRHLHLAEQTDDIVPPLRSFTEGLRELDLGRADRAVAPLEQFNRAYRSSSELRHSFRGNECFLAVAYARLGRGEDGLRLLGRASDSSRCASARGDVLALAGKWRQATRAYREAIRRFPSMPIPWERAGAALLARGEAEAAAQLFRGAAERGPHWADPRFGLAEALMRLGRIEQAEAEYREAARYAPRWGALHIGWGDALWRLGRRGEALERFRAAAGMDLSIPDRMRLQQVLVSATSS